jgi:AraC family transcriptional regulator
MEMTQARVMESPAAQFAAPRLENRGPLLIAGLSERHTAETKQNIPQLWQRFVHYIGNVPGQVGKVAYGVCFNMQLAPFSFEYLAGVQVSNFSVLRPEFSQIRVPAQSYAVFLHGDDVSKLPQTLDAIHKWLPNSGLVVANGGDDAPVFFERYGEGFDPQIGTGDIEVWVPVKA